MYINKIKELWVIQWINCVIFPCNSMRKKKATTKKTKRRTCLKEKNKSKKEALYNRVLSLCKD